MDWFNRLLTSDAPPGTHLRSAEWSLRGPLPGWAVACLLLLFALLAASLYLREPARIGRTKRFLLAALRAVLLGSLLLLAMRPQLVAEFAGKRPRGVAVLVDNSQSMTQRDRRVTPRDRLRAAIALGKANPDSSPDSPEWSSSATDNGEMPTRVELVHSVFGNPSINLLNALATVGPVRTYTFGQRLAPIPEDALRSLSADESKTALVDAIGDLLLKPDGDPPAAVVLITDGVDNGSKLPLDEVIRECVRLAVPVHVYGVGSSDAGILQIKDASIPDTIFYEDTVSIPIRWRGQGLKDGKAVLSILMGDKVVASKEVAIKDGIVAREMLSFTPAKRGNLREEKADLQVTIRSKEDPNCSDQIQRTVQIVDRKVRVLVIEGRPRWEFKFLMPALLRDRRVDAQFVLAEGDRRLVEKPPFLADFPAREKLFSYDLLILGDVPSSMLGTERLAQIQEFVREGGGLIVVAGRDSMPSSYDGSPLAEVLPVEFLPSKHPVDPSARPSSFLPELTPAGERMEMLSLADTPEENQRAWKNLPGFFWHFPVSKLRAGATALLTHPTLRSDDQPMPILAAQFYGKGSVLFLASDESWRWRADGREKLYARFWGQAIYQTGLPHLLGNAQRVQMALERGEAILGRPGYLYARILDQEYKPITEPRLPAILEALDSQGEGRSRPIVLDAVSGRPGEYRTYLSHDTPGRFELKLTRPEAANFSFRVNLPPKHELEPSGLAEGPLSELAKQTGGRLYHEEDLQSLASSIKPQQSPFTQRREILFWNPMAFLILVSLVTAEWLIRKVANMV